MNGPRSSINNLIVVSDLHAGCRYGLCTKEPVLLDGGAYYQPTKYQMMLFDCWQFFWDKWVPVVCRGEPYVIAVNGDALDGLHHDVNTLISSNIADQLNLTESLLKPYIARSKGLYYLRGTEAHGGKAGEYEELLAKRSGAIPNEAGQYSRWELWIRIGIGLVHLTHHISISGSLAYETSAIQKELEQMYTEAARWGTEPPDCIVRSHRHRSCETRVRVKKGERYGFATACTTAGWQLRTPLTYRVAGARRTLPQIGGSLIRCGDEDVYSRHCIWSVQESEVEVPGVKS